MFKKPLTILLKHITMEGRTIMSKKIIGIKQADGSFFPILKDGEPDSKTLELTTVRDGQTTVKINLYKQYEETEELEYVDTLLIENLVPHAKEEPSFALSINLDEDNVLTAEVLDPETGAKSDTSVSLVTLSEAQLGGTSDFELAENPDIFDDIGSSVVSSGDDFSSLADFEEDNIEKNVIEDEVETSSEDSFDLGDSDFNFDDIDLENETEENTVTEDISSMTDSDDSFTMPEDDFNLDDVDFDSNNEENIIDTNIDDFSMDDDTSVTENTSFGEVEDSTTEEGDAFAMPDDDFSFDSVENNDSTEDAFSMDDDFSFAESETTSDTLNIDGDDLSFPESETVGDDFSFPDNATLHDDLTPPDDDIFSSIGTDLGDESFDSLDIGDDSTAGSETQDLSMDDDFGSDSLNLGDDFSSDFDSDSLSLDDSFGTDDETQSAESFSTDSLDLSEDMGTDSIDFNGDFDLDSTETATTEESSLGDDFDIGFGSDDNFDLSSTEESSDIQYAEYGEQTTKTEDSSTSFIPPLYDKKLKEDIEKRRSRGKYSLPMIICIICALICIIAVILAFAFGSWPGDNPNVVNNVVTVEPPQAFEEERKEEGIEIIPPAPEENTIEVVIEAEVVPVKPEPAPEAKMESINYKLIWGDTLWDLSDTYYRNPWLYDTIADANNIANPDYIIAGTYIDIPPR